MQCELRQFNKVFGNVIVSDIKPIDLKGYQVKRQKQALVFTCAGKPVKDISGGIKQPVKIPTFLMADLQKVDSFFTT